MIEKIISKDYDGWRADKYVKSLGVDSFSFLQKLFRTKKIKINKKRATASDRLSTGDVVQIFAVLDDEKKTDDDQLFQKLQKMIIFENDNFLAINKPNKLAVQLGSKITFSVENMIRSQHYFLVHRLDMDTSGVLLIAKNQLWAQKLTAMFRNNQIHKTYIAVVDGKIKSSGIIDDHIEKTFIGKEEKMRVSKNGQRAITHYRPIGMAQYNTILELKPQTGRKHQLRVHCLEELHAPIIGDRKYNPNPHGDMLLHAYKIFIEPLNIEITAPLPKYFPQLIVD